MKYTRTKIYRQKTVSHVKNCQCHACDVARKFGMTLPTKIIGYEPATPREFKELVVYKDKSVKVFISPGQAINPRKEFRREMKRRELSF